MLRIKDSSGRTVCLIGGLKKGTASYSIYILHTDSNHIYSKYMSESVNSENFHSKI